MRNDIAGLAGLVAEAVFYGLFLVLAAGSLRIFLNRDRVLAGLHYAMIFALLLMWGLATTHFTLNVSTNFDSLFGENPSGPGPQGLSDPRAVAKTATFFTVMILGDVIVIVRGLIIWSPRWILVVLPMLFSLASAVLAILVIYVTNNPNTIPLIEKHYEVYGGLIVILSLIANILGVGIIIMKIWSSERRFAAISGRTSLWPVLRILIESGALNAAYLTLYVIVLFESPTILPIVGDIACEVIGIVFTLVIVRAQFYQSYHSRQRTEPSGNISLLFAPKSQGPLSPTKVLVERTVECELDEITDTHRRTKSGSSAV